jgi:myosin protein heavy chain
LEAERQRLEQFTRDQLAQISRARDALLAEKRSTQQTLETRRLELEQQGQLLRTRLQELYEREKKAGDRIEEALPERSVNYRRRRFSSLVDKRKLEDEDLDPEVRALREQLQELKQNMVLLRGERDAAFDELEQLRQQPPPAPTAENADSFSRDAQRSAESADAKLTAEIESLQRQLQEQQTLIERFQAEQAKVPTQPALPSEEWRRELDKLKLERDVALAEVHRLVQEPDDFAQQEEEIVALNRELRRRGTQIQEELQIMGQEHQRLEKTLREYQERSGALDRERLEIEKRDRDAHLREEQMRLREAELREMKEMIEKDNILARKELNEERQQVARLREVLRQERENPRPKTPPPA